MNPAEIYLSVGRPKTTDPLAQGLLLAKAGGRPKDTQDSVEGKY